MHKYRILGLVANHTTDIIKYNISLSNISIIKEYLTHMIIIDSKNEKYASLLQNDLMKISHNNKFIKNYFLVDNNAYYDFGKWIYGLQHIDHKDYDYVLFINDSVVLLDSIDKYFNHINYNLSPTINLFAYNDSTEYKYHYQTYLFLINQKIINKFIKFFDLKKKYVSNYLSLVNHVELCMCDIDENHDCFIKIANDFNVSKNIFWENDILYQYLLTKDIFGIMKLKKIMNIQNNLKMTIYGPSIEDFDYEFYRTYYDDLKNMNDEQLEEHFFNFGQYEGRRFKNNFTDVLPDYYKKKLAGLGLLCFFDLPEDFDLYYYKKINKDISNSSNIDAITHYIKLGMYEGRYYKKDKIYNPCLNNFYISIIDKLKGINNVTEYKVPDFFCPFIHILFNNQYDVFGYLGTILNYNKKNNNLIQLFTRDEFETYTLKFNVEHYKKKNNLKKVEMLDVYQHFLYNSCKDDIKLRLPKDFSVENYVKYNKDLSNLKQDKLIEHYVNEGVFENRLYKLPDDFNYHIYKKIYRDLNNLKKYELEEHYLSIGNKENRIYNITISFNLTKYKNIYKDHDNLNIDEINKIYNNVLHKGSLDSLPNDFDCMTYKKIYKDLENLTKLQLEKHYLNYGVRECRIYKIPDDFDFRVYKRIYPELNNLDEEELKEHYLYVGIHEGKIYKVPDDFDFVIYRKIYSDLSELTEDKLKEHYLFFGIKEDRIYKIPEDFNHELYKKYNSDLSELHNEQLEKHYLFKGISQKLIYKLPNDFDYVEYKNLYNDLKDFDEKQLEEHYLKFGSKGNRLYKLTTYADFEKYIKKRRDVFNINLNYVNNKFNRFESKVIDEEITIENNIVKNNLPDDFNYIVYKKIYKDLNFMSENELKEHYINFGKNEGRLYKLPDDFNAYIYKELNPDLGLLTEKQLTNHYLYNGIDEKRKYKYIKNEMNETNDEINETKEIKEINETKETKDELEKNILPDDFDHVLYKKIYKDLSFMPKEQLKDHYINYGKYEGRIYKLPDDFSTEEYKLLNPDLNNLVDKQLINHFLYNGIQEGRKYKLNDVINNVQENELINNNENENIEIEQHDDTKIPHDFNPYMYKDIYNKELSDMSVEELENHYMTIGKKENRIYKFPEDFDMIFYKTNYGDLGGLSEKQLKDHYLNHGLFEKRIYKLPLDFFPQRYRELNNDLLHLNDHEITKHFITNGNKEERQYV